MGIDTLLSFAILVAVFRKYAILSLKDEHCYGTLRTVRFSTMWYVRPAETQTSLRIRAI